jgi:hypothetical protein
VHRVEEFKYLEVFEELPQGVRAGVFFKLRRDIFRRLEVVVKAQKFSALKYWKKAQRIVLQEDKFRKRTLCSFRRNRQGGIDGRNSPWRIHEVREAVRSCRGAGKLR